MLSGRQSRVPQPDTQRVSQTETREFAFTDYEFGFGRWYGSQADEDSEFNPPNPRTHPWDAAVNRRQVFAA